MSMVKLVIIHGRGAWQNFGPSYFSSQESFSLHFSFKLGVIVPLLCSPALQGTELKHLNFLQHPFLHRIATKARMKVEKTLGLSSS